MSTVTTPTFTGVSQSTGGIPTLPTALRHSVIAFQDGDGRREEAHAINYTELYNLKGRLLTLVDATFTDPEQRAAHKTLVWRTLTGWMEDTVMEGYESPSMKAGEVAEGNRA